MKMRGPNNQFSIRAHAPDIDSAYHFVKEKNKKINKIRYQIYILNLFENICGNLSSRNGKYPKSDLTLPEFDGENLF